MPLVAGFLPMPMGSTCAALTVAGGVNKLGCGLLPGRTVMRPVFLANPT